MAILRYEYLRYALLRYTFLRYAFNDPSQRVSNKNRTNELIMK